MKKRMISLLVLAAMLLTILPVTALAEDELVAVEAPELEAPAEEITVIDEIAVEEAETYLATASSIKNPRIVEDSSMEAGQRVTYDCIWFGSYPQAEVVNSKDMMTYAIGEAYLNDNDYIVDATLYSKLQSATGWSNNEITLGGNKYRRMRLVDATYTDSQYSSHYTWNDSTTYHYFKYQPIKWRVLQVNGSTALLLADESLDDVVWNSEAVYGNEWATSEMRSWLNSYGASSNTAGTDYSCTGFLGSAFTTTEKAAILNCIIQNNVCADYTDGSGTATTDRIFLLSHDQSLNAYYGFSTNYRTHDEARRARASTYASARGTNCGISTWWLRSAGSVSNEVWKVSSSGYSVYTGDYYYTVNSPYHGARPALYINLTSSCWSDAGTVCTDGTIAEQGGSTKLTGWQKADGKWYYYNTDGSKATGWKQISGKWYYFASDGTMKTGWLKLSGKWYYLKSSGEMAKGWLKIGSTYYYFDNSGVMKTGWQQIAKKWYYLGSDGAMKTGWQQISKKWYYLGSDGAMRTGWQQISKKWYYFYSDGDMKTGWHSSGGSWYYLKSSGEMAVSESIKIGTKTYKFNASGVCTNP